LDLKSYNDIARDPTHKIEVQIPYKENNILYTIKDTELENLILNINNSDGFILTTTLLNEPNTYKEAIESHEKHEWYKACLEEVRELETQGTYKIIDLPKDKNITPIKGR
jgi:hypothetical protein